MFSSVAEIRQVFCFLFVCRMEETVRSLLPNQTADTVDIMKVYKVRPSPPISSRPAKSGLATCCCRQNLQVSRRLNSGKKPKCQDLLSCC